MESFLLGVLGLTLLGLYFLPLLIAVIRKTKYCAYIIAINILLGWTVLGWIAAMLWAILEDREERPPAVVDLDETQIVKTKHRR